MRRQADRSAEIFAEYSNVRAFAARHAQPRGIRQLDSQERESIDRHAARPPLDVLALARKLVEALALMTRSRIHRRRLRDPSDKLGKCALQARRPIARNIALLGRLALCVLRRRRAPEYEGEDVAFALIGKQ